MKKRMIAMLLCVLMALFSMGGAVFAAEEPATVEEPIAEETVPLGQMVTGWQEIDGIWYHFDIYDSLGALNTGWYETSAGRYYLDPDTGAMTIGWRTIDGVQYYFDENGRVVE